MVSNVLFSSAAARAMPENTCRSAFKMDTHFAVIATAENLKGVSATSARNETLSE